MSKFIPVNRHIVVEHVEPSPEAEDKSSILIPKDYKPQQSEHVAVKVLSWADDVKIKPLLEKHNVAIVNRGMIQKIDHGAEEHHIVLENYVFGFFEDA